jgi:hypothetical protein
LVKNQVTEILEAGVIRPSSSPWASPITLVPKKDGDTHFCVDFRKLNSVCRKDSYTLPNISDIFDSMRGATLFSMMDLKSGYWQIPMASQNIEKMAFICTEGLFEWVRMPFGFCNSGAVFQRAMNDIFRDFVGKYVHVFVDDIVVYSRNPTEQAHHVRQVMSKIQEYNLQLKKKKCDFASKSVDILGYHISAPESEGQGYTRNVTNP